MAGKNNDRTSVNVVGGTLARKVSGIVLNTIIAIAVFACGYIAAAVAERGNSPAMYCPYGQAEDDCQPDFRGKGKWVLTP